MCLSESWQKATTDMLEQTLISFLANAQAIEQQHLKGKLLDMRVSIPDESTRNDSGVYVHNVQGTLLEFMDDWPIPEHKALWEPLMGTIGSVLYLWEMYADRGLVACMWRDKLHPECNVIYWVPVDIANVIWTRN